MSSRAMSAVDHAWYRMDSPENLMMVHAIMWTDQPLDWERVRAEIAAQMLERFPKFRQHPVPPRLPLGRSGWSDDEDFDLDRHLVARTLGPAGDQAALADYVATQISIPLDPTHPMWQVHLLDGYGTGSAVLFRMHHSIADGITLTRVLLSLTSSNTAHAGFTADEPRSRVAQIFDLSSRLGREGLRALRAPDRTLVAATTAVRGVRRLAHLAAIPAKPRSALAGQIGVDKHVTWTDPWPLPAVKRISRGSGVTVNDVLLAVLADALGRYLAEKGTPLEQVRVMVPVNLRPLDQPLPSDLGNIFGEYVVALPTGEMDPMARLIRMHAITDDLKDSPEAVVAYLTLVAIGAMPDQVEDLSTKLFSGKIVATVSNVPGPRSVVTLAGTPVAGIIGWVPAAGDVGLGVSMFSYNDQVLVGLIADKLLIGDLARLKELLALSFADLADRAEAVTLAELATMT